jgi:alpha-L-fucosidase
VRFAQKVPIEDVDRCVLRKKSGLLEMSWKGSWFDGAGFGLFVHWDHASQQGIEVSWPLIGRSIVHEGDKPDVVSVAQYHASAATFNPLRWDAVSLAKLARSCGARYIVFTTRHHSGYSMFHTKASDFSIEHSPYGADITRQLIEAVRAEGLRVGLYYSLSDWHHPDYPAFEESSKPYLYEHYPRPSSEAWARYLDYVRAQLTELLTNYGTIDLVWFDGQWERTAEEWHADQLRKLVASLQPDAIVNDRLPGQGDYETPEQFLPTAPPARPWELCLTMNDSWGWRPSDTNYKSPRDLARWLADAVSRGGNLLLNVSPMGDGSLPDVQVSHLRQLGDWIATHGEAVIGVRPAPASVDFYGPATLRGDRLYLHLVAQPVENVLVRGIPVRRVRGVTLLGTNEALRYRLPLAAYDDHLPGSDVLAELIIDAPAPSAALMDVIAIDFDGPLS